MCAILAKSALTGLSRRQQVADFGQQLLFGRGLGRRFRLRRLLLLKLFLQAIDALDHQEQHLGDDQETGDGVDEQAVIDRRRARLLRRFQAVELACAQIDEQVREIDPAGDHAKDRVDDVGDEALDDRVKAAPMTMPTPISTTLPLTAKSLNS
jgi:hypothetical protein